MNEQNIPNQNNQPLQGQVEGAAQKKGSNTALKVVLGILGCCLVLTIIAMIAGTLFTRSVTNKLKTDFAEKGVESLIENQIEKETGKKVDIDTDTENGKFEIKDDEGSSFSFGSESKLPDDFPTDVPVYSGAKVASSSRINDSKSGELSFLVVLSTPDDAKKVMAFYNDKLKGNGWAIEATYDSTYGSSVTASKSERSLAVYIYENKQEKSTSVSLTLKEK